MKKGTEVVDFDFVDLDMNLVKNPLFFLEYRIFRDKENEDVIKTTFPQIHNDGKWMDISGYEYHTAEPPPVIDDHLVLLYLLSKSQHKGWVNELNGLSHYEIIHDSGLDKNRSRWGYERLADSLERWKKVVIKFNGTFYDNKLYRTVLFNIIDVVKIDSENKIYVKFSTEFIDILRLSNFKVSLDRIAMIRLKKNPVAYRLYQIMKQNLTHRKEWPIEAMKLASKIPLQEKYPSAVLKKILPALQLVSDNTEIRALVDVSKDNDKTVLLFHLDEEIADATFDRILSGLSDIGQEAFKDCVCKLPSDYSSDIDAWKILAKWISKKDRGYVLKKIEYTNANSSQKGKYLTFLQSALEGDWGRLDRTIQMRENAVRQESQEMKKKGEEAIKSKMLDMAYAKAKSRFKDMTPEEVHEEKKKILEEKGNIDEKIKNFPGLLNMMIISKLRDVIFQQMMNETKSSGGQGE